MFFFVDLDRMPVENVDNVDFSDELSIGMREDVFAACLDAARGPILGVAIEGFVVRAATGFGNKLK